MNTIISAIVIAIMLVFLISYIIVIFRAKKDGVVAVGFRRISSGNWIPYGFLALAIFQVVAQLNIAAEYQAEFDSLSATGDVSSGYIQYCVEMAQDAKAEVVLYLITAALWLVVIFGNLSLFTESEVYTLDCFKPKRYTAETHGKYIRIFISGEEMPRFRFKRTEKNMERFKDFLKAE